MLGPTIHNLLLENGMVRVAVTKVLDSNAQVPMPTDEVTKVGEALNAFIVYVFIYLHLGPFNYVD